MRWVAAWLLSTRSAICIGSVAGTIRRISRAALSSRMVMSSGFDKEHGFESFYLTNTETGQRINLDFEAKTPTYSVDVYIGEKHDIDPGGVYCWRRDGGSVKWVNINDWAAWVASMGAARYATRSPAYVVIDRWFVRLDIVVNDVLFAKWIAETEPQGDGVELIQLSMGQLFDLHNKLREEACASN